ncbi:methanol dehydrogenase [cytochrome c] subunit [Hyphomicrobium sp.]|uniref:methanol dehydrogenase [cytochrome c] subunit n=1 Tax=Hyphomicrobium sp. TaxID=82 RepID=UPI002E3094F6|nr:methanol dehydrogenase [cytochrome c] subunit [Hyphomicrobium sp.]HEX2842551.1 methanol dehydrogenase [cytochrome c] subunit [Hyphomicrobium sp.]
MTKKSLVTLAASAVILAVGAGVAGAYDGTKCKAAGNCWEPKPGYPEKVAGSKYDPKHDPKELAKQQKSLDDQAARNAQRSENFKKTGKWVYDVKKIQ